LLLTQAFNSLGSTIAPYFGGLLILSAAPKSTDQLRRMSTAVLQSYRLQQAAHVKTPYIVIAITLFVLGMVIAGYSLPAMRAEHKSAFKKGAPVSSVWKHRHLVLGAIGIFVAVGAEVAIGSFLVNYFTQPDIAGLTPKTAAGFVSLYWAGAMIGRFAGSGLMQRVPASTVLGIAAVVVLALITTAILTSGTISMRSMLLIGIFNSIMFPTVFTLGIAELGPLTSAGSGILMAAAVGGAIVPVLQGAIADEIGVHHSFILPALCYLYIAFYGFYGSKPVGSIVAGINHGKQAVS
jgi:FHS family L-fucose permease-like MFS transporter